MTAHVTPPAIPWHDFGMARRFLEALDGNARGFSFAMFDDKRDEKRAARIALNVPRAVHTTLDEAWPTILKLNQPGALGDRERNYAAYVTVNEALNGDRKNIVRVRALYADCDDRASSLYATQTISKTDFPPPSMIVKSSHGKLHFYWFLKDHVAPSADVLAMLKELVRKLTADSKAADLARVLRLPGTLHLKGAPQQTTLKSAHKDRRYTLGELKAAIQALPEPPAAGGGQNIVIPFNARQRASLSHGGPIAGLGGGGMAAAHDTGDDADELRAGLEANPWSDDLPPDEKKALVKDALASCTKIADGGRKEWLSVLAALFHSGVDDAEQLAEEWSATSAKQYDPNKFAEDWAALDNPQYAGKRASLGTLIKLAQACGWDSEPWKAKADAARGALVLQARQAAMAGGGPLGPIPHDTYDEKTALDIMNINFAVIEFPQETMIGRAARRSGEIVLTSVADARLKLAPIKVKVGEKVRPIFDWWFSHKDRTVGREAIFDPRRPPGIACGQDECNFWQGFAVQPMRGTDKAQSMLDHIEKVICRSDPTEFEYLIRWLAWIFQHPGEAPGVCVVLKSNNEGTGKSTLGEAIQHIFGHHGMMINDPDRLLGRFNDHLEHIGFALLEEAVFAGDPRITDRIKSRLTASTVPIEGKGRKTHSTPNRLAAMSCTNHDHAIDASADARRWFVVEVSPERKGDAAYFKKLHGDLRDGGYEQLLYYFQNYPLGDWHPRNPPQTNALKRQKLLSMPNDYAWLWECAEAGQVVGARQDVGLPTLGGDVPIAALQKAHTGWSRDRGHKPAKPIALGRTLHRILGRKKRGAADPNGHRPRYYSLPGGPELRAKIAGALGIPLEGQSP
jgi:Family of unknown function (DUF5906)/Primase C terminal 2 (PriCT-2)/RepB DNA-primase from phage plasmid